MHNQDFETWATEDTADKAAECLVQCCEKAIAENCYVASRAYAFASHFEGYSLSNLTGYGATMNTDYGQDDPIFKNDVRSLVFSFVNKSSANDSPRPQFVTKDADYEQQLRAEDLDLAVSAEMDRPHGMFNDIDDLVRHGVMIAASSTGQFYVFSIIYEDSAEPNAELDDSLTVGVYREGQWGKVKMLCRTVWMNPEVAVSRFGSKHAEAIDQAVESMTGTFRSGAASGGIHSVTPDSQHLSRRLVRVFMGWDVLAGRELMCLKDGHVLRDNAEYDRSEPPCVSWEYRRDLSGTRGTPLSADIYELNCLYNRIMGDVVASDEKTPQVVIGVQAGSEEAGSVKEQVRDVKGVLVLETTAPPGTALNFGAPPKFNRDSPALMQIVQEQIYSNSQISENHATGSKPVGTTSGVQEAMAASYYTEAHADAERRLIAMRVQGLARLFAHSIQELVDGPGYERMVGEDMFRKQLKGQDLDLDMDKYRTTIKAVSEQKDSPQSRIDEAREMLKDPTIQFTGKDFNDTMATYDVDSAVDRAYSNRAWAEDQVELWLKAPIAKTQEADFFQPPELSMGLEGLEAAKTVVNRSFLKARSERVPIERLKFFEAFLNQCLALIHQEQARLASLQAPTPGVMPGA